MSNKALISLVIVLLIGILSIAIIRKNHPPQEESVGSQISKSINEGAEEVADEIDDHTDDK